MSQNYSFTVIIEKEDDMFVAHCPDLDITSQGETVESAKSNLKEAIELFFECASPEEIKTRIHNEVFVTNLEIAVA